MFERIRELVAEKVGIDPEDITPDTSFADDLDADSITLFELIMAIEDEFDIEVDDESIEKIETVGDIVKYLEEINN
ncbi:MAG TPA: acyl carrier protein [Sedimentibacter sp.]|jgi:acyl carrier protein|nr:acyl carrier protein [Sedimentibacter sp.]HHZ00360.1 acyl carrier protein [Tissierellia bacterium]HOK49636.1 acyl carrier protein [Sedimentibacter sp.]HOW23558.1 acyl carrier protein [Sedimentibacter sp.]HRC80088.1 acyl carrier protein [Sedimentibacter sp.]